MNIPRIEYQDKDGKPVSSTRDPEWKYTLIGSTLRTVKDGPPEQLVNGAWQAIPK